MAPDLLSEDDAPSRRRGRPRVLLRVVRLLSLLVAVAVGSFVLLLGSPVDPIDAYVGADVAAVGPEQRAQIEERWGLDRPPIERLADWGGRLLQGDLGHSQVYDAPVTAVIADRFAASLSLMALAWLISGVLGFSLGLLAGMRSGGRVDRALTWVAYLLASSPTFWVALVLLYVFSVSLQWTPVCCAAPVGMLPGEAGLLDRLHHLLLPALTLSVVGISPVLLHTREATLEVLRSDYVRFARAQGERGWGLTIHRVLRNAAGPALMLQFSSVGELFGGSLLAEQVFTYPGLGEATTTAALRQDVPLLLGIALFTALFVFAGNALGDLAHRSVDPRLRAEAVR